MGDLVKLGENKPKPRGFQKGMAKLGGRKKGTSNVATGALRQLMQEVAASVGSDGKGKGGWPGWLAMMCRRFPTDFLKGLIKLEPKEFAMALEKTFDMEVTYETAEEARAALREYGIVIEGEAS